MPLSQISDGMDSHHEIVPKNKVRSNEKVWLDLVEMVKDRLFLTDEDESQRYTPGKHFAHQRKICIGISNIANAWTDSTSFVAINREFLEKQTFNIVGLCNVGRILLHEFCHRDTDLDNHDHDQGFYELFHDSADDFIGAFVDGCFGSLPQVMAEHNRKLTRPMLHQRDTQVLGQRGTGEMDKNCTLPSKAR